MLQQTDADRDGAAPQADSAAQTPATKRPGWRIRRRMRRRMRDYERTRTELLYDLGGVVHELQRHGRREPRLLLPKAAAVAAVDAELRELQQALVDPRKPASVQRCSACGSEPELGQLVCLECGARLEPEQLFPRRKASRVVIAVVVLLLGAGGVIAYTALDGRGDANAPQAAESRQRSEVELGGLQETPHDAETVPEASPRVEPAPAPKQRDIVKDGTIYDWPRDLSGYTVVLTSNGDRQSAVRFAASAAEKGDRFGVLRTDDFSSLSEGFYIVFAGRYESEAQAKQAATELRDRFASAFAQRVSP